MNDMLLDNDSLEIIFNMTLNKKFETRMEILETIDTCKTLIGIDKRRYAKYKPYLDLLKDKYDIWVKYSYFSELGEQYEANLSEEEKKGISYLEYPNLLANLCLYNFQEGYYISHDVTLPKTKYYNHSLHSKRNETFEDIPKILEYFPGSVHWKYIHSENARELYPITVAALNKNIPLEYVKMIYDLSLPNEIIIFGTNYSKEPVSFLEFVGDKYPERAAELREYLGL